MDLTFNSKNWLFYEFPSNTFLLKTLVLQNKNSPSSKSEPVVLEYKDNTKYVENENLKQLREAKNTNFSIIYSFTCIYLFVFYFD